MDQDCVNQLKKAVNEDLIHDKSQENKTGRKKRKLGMRKNQRKVCNNWLDSLDNDTTKNCPINLANLNFEIFSRYISTRKTVKGEYLSKITYGGMQSGLSHLYRCCDLEIPDNFSADMTTLMQGMKRTVARDKQKKGTRVEDGKSPMTIDVYKLICEFFLGQESDESIFCHSFLTLEWNLMARADNV